MFHQLLFLSHFFYQTSFIGSSGFIFEKLNLTCPLLVPSPMERESRLVGKDEGDQYSEHKLILQCLEFNLQVGKITC